MSRERSKPLRILERLLAVLEEDAALHPTLWWQTPATMTIRPSAAHSSAPRPFVAIEAGESEPESGGAVDRHRDLLHLTAWLETADAADPYQAAHELASDFRRFLDRHRQLEAEDGEPWVECGQILDRGYAIAIDFAEGGAGGGLIEFKFDVSYDWTGTTA